MDRETDNCSIEKDSNFIDSPLYMRFKRSSTSCSNIDHRIQMALPTQHRTLSSTTSECSLSSPHHPILVNTVLPDADTTPPPLPPRTSPIPSHSPTPFQTPDSSLCPLFVAPPIPPHSPRKQRFSLPSDNIFTPPTVPNIPAIPKRSHRPLHPSKSVDSSTFLPTPHLSLPSHTLIHTITPHLITNPPIPPQPPLSPDFTRSPTLPIPPHSPTHIAPPPPHCSPNSTDLTSPPLPPRSPIPFDPLSSPASSIPPHRSVPIDTDISAQFYPVLDFRPPTLTMSSTPPQAPLTDERAQKIQPPLLSQGHKKPLLCSKSYSDMYLRPLPTYKQLHSPSNDLKHLALCDNGEPLQEPRENESQENECFGLVHSRCLILGQKNKCTVHSYHPTMTQEEKCLECPPTLEEGKHIELVHSNCSSVTEKGDYLELIHSNLPPAPQLSQQAEPPSLKTKLPHHSCTKEVSRPKTDARAYLHQPQRGENEQLGTRGPSGDAAIAKQAGCSPVQSERNIPSRECLQRMISAPPSATSSELPSSHFAPFNVPDSRAHFLCKERLSETKASPKVLSSHFENLTPLLKYEARLREDSDSDSDEYVVPDSEFQPKKNNFCPQKDAKMGKGAFENGSQEWKNKGLFPTLGVVRHVAEERSERKGVDGKNSCKDQRQ